MKKCLTVCFLWVLSAGAVLAAPATPFRALARLPVREVTVFKDGHAFVLHSGRLPVDSGGNVVMDYLPCPVIGTFWPFSADRRAPLVSVTASQHKVLVEHTTLSLTELIEANVGAQVMVTETSAQPYAATILELPAQSSEEQEESSPPYTGEKLPQKGSVVLLKTSAGVKVVNLDRIQDISFVGAYKQVLPREEFRNLLTLKLGGNGAGQRQTEAEVGLLYLQRGIRWIPNYKVTIDGKGRATVKLQATLINELADLHDVTANLVIGVPTFDFKETPDPISLQQSVAQLSQYFQQDSRTAYGFANAIMSQQTSRMGEMHREATPVAGPSLDLAPEVEEAGRSEDLFVFTIKHVTLRKGERMVMPIREFTMAYKDVFVLDLPFAPPTEVWRNFDNNRQAELARMFAAPKVLHKIRLFNRSDCPLTTAPALILRDDRLLAQGLMTYTAPGADADLNLTAAMDVRVKKTDNEIKRTPNTVAWQGDQYGRVDLAGALTLTSYRPEPVTVEVVRHVLGNVDSADHDGKIEMVNVFEDSSFAGGANPLPGWWRWFSWPWWWRHFNGAGRVTWTVELQPRQPLDLAYTWNYYWR